jgi:DNA repair protein RadC
VLIALLSRMLEAVVPDLPRERFLNYGGDRVTTTELLALILGTGRRGRNATLVAQDIFHAVGGLTQLAECEPAELVSLPGVGAARATRIAAAFQLGRRAMAARMPAARRAMSAGDIYHRLAPRLAGVMQEVFFVVALNAQHGIIRDFEVARGTLSQVEVHPREVFRPLIRHAAAATIVAHNHPSGDPAPSPDDVLLTQRLRAVGEIVGIPVLDHVVMGHGRFTSIAALLGLHNG